MKIESRYLDGAYLTHNPTWDREDAKWKARQVRHIIEKNSIIPQSVVEVGCGSGDILRSVRSFLDDATLVGYDISPQAQGFWVEDSGTRNSKGIEFHLGDFHALNTQQFDLLLMIDVFEHVRDPFTFLEESRKYARQFIFHIPLDLSAFSVLRGRPLLEGRRRVGHLHAYTKDLALETLTDCGYQIIDWFYTGASLNMPNRSFKTRIAHIPRLITGYLNKDFAVRLFGGETLLVLAK